MFDTTGSILMHGIFVTEINSTTFGIKFSDVLT
jgi:hypothetical protein